MLDEEACDASQSKRCAAAPAVTGEDDEVWVLPFDGAHELEPNAIMGEDGSHAHPLVAELVTEALQVSFGHPGVALDQAPFELALFVVQGLGLDELGHWDDVNQDQLGTVLASETNRERQGVLGLW